MAGKARNLLHGTLQDSVWLEILSDDLWRRQRSAPPCDSPPTPVVPLESGRWARPRIDRTTLHALLEHELNHLHDFLHDLPKTVVEEEYSCSVRIFISCSASKRVLVNPGVHVDADLGIQVWIGGCQAPDPPLQLRKIVREVGPVILRSA